MRNFIALTGALLLAIGLTVLIQPPEAHGIAAGCPPFALHRANSLVKLEASIQAGTHWIDMDERPSISGALFLYHDAGVVETHTTAYLDSHGFTRLSTALRGMKKYGVPAFLEIKAEGDNTYGRMVPLVDEYGADRVTITSFHRDYLNRYRNLRPNQSVSLT
jgi:hypothetical protein